MAQFQEEKQKRKVILLHRHEEEESAQLIAKRFSLPYTDLSKFPVETDAIRIIPKEKARHGNLAVFQIIGRQLKIGVLNPTQEHTVAVLKHIAEEGYVYNLFLVSHSSLEYAWNFYEKVPKTHTSEAGTIQVSETLIRSLQKELINLDQIKEHTEKSFLSKTTEVVEIILAGALATNTSDIHIEPQHENARLRFRLDGVLNDVSFIPKKLYTLLLSRIKLMSELKLNIHDSAQDGRFTIQSEGFEVEVRVSTLPGPEGENIVLRMLNPKTIQIPFEELGMQPWIHQTMNAELKKPNGMILTTGPTGSGKTTTLYAFLKKIHTPEIKIITIEDPIEYHVPGIEQTQVDQEKQYSFANGLRAIVRQDPDIILVGEIRDLETAETAMHASLTGHLVFSTLHTNDAAGTIPRLIDLGVKPAIIAPAINVSMAQRLLRRLCSACRIGATENPEEKIKIQKELSGFPHAIPLPPEQEWHIFHAQEKGCDRCNHTGYKGRIGVFEIILIDEQIEQLILKEPSEFEIKKQAAAQGQITMRQDGILKILAGVTDFNELERVVGA